MSNHRPNILLILTDDQGPWAMGCAGNDELRTPNLDRLAAGGIRFDSFFCASPVCSPARCSILTGRMPSQHGVHDWLRAGNSTIEGDRQVDGQGELIEYLHGLTGYTDILAANGYTCGLSGKWHMGDAHHPQKGFSFWEAHALGGSSYYEAPMIREGEVYREPRYVTDTITDHALSFLDRQTGDAPWYLSVHYTAPHSPWDRANHPTVTWDDYYKNCPFESVPQTQKHPAVGNRLWPTSPADRRAKLAGYFTAITEMDRNVGRLLAWLDEHGQRQNTLIVFTGDNGMNMGHHGLYGKGNASFPQNMYDTSVKVPCIVNRPDSVPAGLVNDDLLSHYDLMPTLLDYAGLDNPEADELPGASFAGLLRGEAMPERESVVVFDEYGPVRMIRTREWKYVHRTPYGPHELYDLLDDPDETIDLFGNPEYAEKADELRLGLHEWFARYSDPAVDGRGEPVTGFGQVGLAGMKGDGRVNYVPR